MSASLPDQGAGGEEQRESASASSSQPAAYDFSADLTLHEAEDDSLDASSENIEAGAPIEMPRIEIDPATYDFRADLVLREEEDGLIDAASVPEASLHDAQPLGEYDPSIDLKLDGIDEPASPLVADAASVAAAEQVAQPVDPLAEPLAAMPPPPAEEWAAEERAYEAARDLEIEDAEEDYLIDLPGKQEVPSEVGGAWNVAAASGLDAGAQSELSAVAAEAESAIAARLARGKGNSRRGRRFRQPAGGLSWLVQLETWLVIAAISLFFQLFPAAFWRVMAVVDVRNWTWGVWVGVEIAVIAVLLLLKVRQAADA